MPRLFALAAPPIGAEPRVRAAMLGPAPMSLTTAARRVSKPPGPRRTVPRRRSGMLSLADAGSLRARLDPDPIDGACPATREGAFGLVSKNGSAVDDLDVSQGP